MDIDDYLVGQRREVDKIFPACQAKLRLSEDMYARGFLYWPYKSMLTIKHEIAETIIHKSQAKRLGIMMRKTPSMWLTYLEAFGFRASILSVDAEERGVEIHVSVTHKETGEKDILVCNAYSFEAVQECVDRFYRPNL